MKTIREESTSRHMKSNTFCVADFQAMGLDDLQVPTPTNGSA